VYPERSFPLSPKLDSDKPGKSTALDSPPMPLWFDSAGTEIHRASAIASSIPDKPLRSQIWPQIPSGHSGNLPSQVKTLPIAVGGVNWIPMWTQMKVSVNNGAVETEPRLTPLQRHGCAYAGLAGLGFQRLGSTSLTS
jgi:hypothetical protein